MGGCATYRIYSPFKALPGIDPTFEFLAIPFLPNVLEESPEKTLIRLIEKFDLVIVQRCYLLPIVQRVYDACQFLGKPLIFETDDDYLNLERHNPCYLGMVNPEIVNQVREIEKTGDPGQIQQAHMELEGWRQQGLNDFKKIISMVDGVTVSTPELKRTLYPYNKNIIVLENQIERIYPLRDNLQEEMFRHPKPDGGWEVKIPNAFGLMSIPNWCVGDEKLKVIKRVVRVGYSGTSSHRGKDFYTVKKGLFEVINKFKNDTWTVYLGDPYFYLWQRYQDKSEGDINYYLHLMQSGQHDKLPPSKHGGRQHFCPATEYKLYMFNLRNIDLCLAPLEPNTFNMSKSDIKALESAAWGVPGILPNYITYNRHWIHEETALLYNNEEEFKDCLERLIKDHSLRDRLGKNAQEYARTQRLESLHAEKRFNFYDRMIKENSPLKIFQPNKK